LQTFPPDGAEKRATPSQQPTALFKLRQKFSTLIFFTAEKNGGKKHKSHFFAEPFSGPSVAGLPDGFVFKPKIPIWVNFGGPWNILCTTIWNIYGHLV
jgi:hypothetical protein